MEIKETEYSEIIQVRHQVMYPEKEIDFVKLEGDELGIHIGVHEKSELISVTSIFLKDRDVQFRKLATKQSFQRQGYATKLIEWVLAYAKEMELNKVWANARVNVLPFYEKLGFKRTDETFSRNGYDYVVVEFFI